MKHTTCFPTWRNRGAEFSPPHDAESNVSGSGPLIPSHSGCCEGVQRDRGAGGWSSRWAARTGRRGKPTAHASLITVWGEENSFRLGFLLRSSGENISVTTKTHRVIRSHVLDFSPRIGNFVFCVWKSSLFKTLFLLQKSSVSPRESREVVSWKHFHFFSLSHHAWPRRLNCWLLINMFMFYPTLILSYRLTIFWCYLRIGNSFRTTR